MRMEMRVDNDFIFPERREMKRNVTIVWDEVQGSLASSVSLLFPGSLLYTERSFRKIHYAFQFPIPNC